MLREVHAVGRVNMEVAMSLLQRLFRFLRGNPMLREQEEDRVLRNGSPRILYLPLRIPQYHAEVPESKIKKPPKNLVHVRVDGLPWKEVYSFEFYGPNDQVFVLNAKDGCIVFGDGVHGSRLPAGIKNIFSSYRIGAGPTGDVPAGQKDSTSSYSSLIYLVVWTRDLTALEDASLREIALGGPDTSTRRDP